MSADPTQLPLFVTCPKGLEELLKEELTDLGGQQCRQTVGGVHLLAEQATAYRIALWSRLGNRLLLVLSNFEANCADDLYQAASAIAWQEHLGVDDTFAVDCIERRSFLQHSHFGALKVKDAIVDQFAQALGRRPSVDANRPQLRVNLTLRKRQASLAIDLSGDSLHKRGYRLAGSAAPLKENLAAALLLRAGWPTIAARGGSLVDPLCGSGTLLIEAAMMAAQMAPGLLRERFGLEGWRGHALDLWQELRAEAEQRARTGLAQLPPLYGYDKSSRALETAQDNVERAGLLDQVHLLRRPLHKFQLPPEALERPGLLITNPPYGERLGEQSALRPLYRQLGDLLKQHLGGWQAAIFTGLADARIGLAPQRSYKLFNGPIECRMFRFDMVKGTLRERPNKAEGGGAQHAG